jgi:hypothetical protein
MLVTYSEWDTGGRTMNQEDSAKVNLLTEEVERLVKTIDGSIEQLNKMAAHLKAKLEEGRKEAEGCKKKAESKPFTGDYRTTWDLGDEYNKICFAFLERQLDSHSEAVRSFSSLQGKCSFHLAMLNKGADK